MALYFITGNQNKLKEAQAIIPNVEQIELDLPEIQELDPQKVIAGKLNAAIKEQKGEFFVEDTSLYLDCLNGFPGPLIKWFLGTLGREGISDLVSKYQNEKVIVKTVIGYTNGKDIHFFTGELPGIVVPPRGESNFGWDPIFQPEGHDKTFAEMTAEEKNAISMRKRALMKLKEHLEKN